MLSVLIFLEREVPFLNFVSGVSAASDLAGRFFSSCSDPIAHSSTSSPETVFLNSYPSLPLSAYMLNTGVLN